MQSHKIVLKICTKIGTYDPQKWHLGLSDSSFFLLQEFVKLGYPKAVHRISMSYYDTGLDVCGGDVVVFKPSLLFFLVQSEQLKETI